MFTLKHPSVDSWEVHHAETKTVITITVTVQTNANELVLHCQTKTKQLLEPCTLAAIEGFLSGTLRRLSMYLHAKGLATESYNIERRRSENGVITAMASIDIAAPLNETKARKFLRLAFREETCLLNKTNEPTAI